MICMMNFSSSLTTFYHFFESIFIMLKKITLLLFVNVTQRTLYLCNKKLLQEHLDILCQEQEPTAKSKSQEQEQRARAKSQEKESRTEPRAKSQEQRSKSLGISHFFAQLNDFIMKQSTLDMTTTIKHIFDKDTFGS